VAWSAFVVRSSHRGDSLRLWPRDAPVFGLGWKARLEFGEGLHAEANVDVVGHGGAPLQLDRYFASLAKQWRGWRDELAWDGDNIELAARHDGLGTVTLTVMLECWDEDEPLVEPWTTAARVGEWRVYANLFVDAGALDQLAGNAGRGFANPGW
jgi:hypothetical protein